MTESAGVERLPDEEFKRVLCVVAHPDDLEYGTSAAVAEWTDRGIEVSYLLLTKGEAGMQIPPEECARIRRGEQERACAQVGVSELVMLDHPDGMLVYSLEIRRDIARRIREFKPDAVVTGAWDLEASWGLNMADHRVAGVCVLDAVRDADNTWVHPELAKQENLPKWGTRWLLVGGHPKPTHGVPVSDDAVQRAVKSLQAHEEYLAAIPGHPAPAEFIPAMLEGGGKALGVEHAMLFGAFDLRGRPAGP
ncbi:MAG: PIG-L deacetylase family protein [Micropruina sp.]|uniref:PIG-L deacetylase family protein n=1 Tax=Micropruina sp. TaxID=2737536 RepID=UPI0039E3DD02